MQTRKHGKCEKMRLTGFNVTGFPKKPSRTKNSMESKFTNYGEKNATALAETTAVAEYYGIERRTIFSTEGSFGFGDPMRVPPKFQPEASLRLCGLCSGWQVHWWLGPLLGALQQPELNLDH